MAVWYEERTARDPNTGGAAADGVELELFDYTDTSYTTPLVVTDINGLSLNKVVSRGGIFPGFYGPDSGHVRYKAANGDVGVWEAWEGVRDSAAEARDAAQAALAQVEDLADAPSVLPSGGNTGDVLTRGATERTGVWAPPGSGGAATWDTLQGKPSTFPPSPHSHTTTDISDSSTVGKALMKASDAAAARAAISAAPSTVVSFPGFGSTAGTAAPGNHTHDAANIPFAPSGSITATNVQAAIGQAASSGGGTSDALFVFVRDYTSGAWPVRGRDDGVCRWRGPSSAGNPPAGGSYAKPGMDERMVTVS